MGGALTVGIVGVGRISEEYLRNLPTFPQLRLVAVADLDRERARAVAAEHGVRALGVDELLADPEVDCVLNLTIPAAHVEIGVRALTAGKHVFAEKPLGLDAVEAAPLVDLAERSGLRIASAPDTVLGTGVQTARRALDSGLIGAPIAAQVHWSAPGHERWHPSPAFYYQPGGGPLLDMGPYYLTALVHLFGAVTRVSGVATRSDRARSVGTGPLAGTPLPVAVDTHIGALLRHANGATTTLTVSFEVRRTRSPLFEVYGTDGTLAVPDPNFFSGPVEVALGDEPGWTVLEDSAGVIGTGRGAGLADLAVALREDRPERASGRLALHVLEVMDAILRSSADGVVVPIASTVERPEPVPLQTPAGDAVDGARS